MVTLPEQQELVHQSGPIVFDCKWYALLALYFKGSGAAPGKSRRSTKSFGERLINCLSSLSMKTIGDCR